MIYAQIVLATVEMFLVIVVIAQLRGPRDPLLLPLVIVIVGAGVLLPRRYPLHHATAGSLALQAAAVAVLWGMRTAGNRRTGVSGR